MGKWIRKRLYNRSSWINRPSYGGPVSYGDETQRGQGSPLGKPLPYCSTSGRLTPIYPPPPWRSCVMLWINNFSSSTNVWKSSGASSNATGAGPQGLLARQGAGFAATMEGVLRGH